MGSQFIDLYVADPNEAHAAVRGDRPELLATLLAAGPPDEPKDALRPALTVMAQGTFCFLPKAVEHPEGILYCRAFEAILKTILSEVGGRRWGIECYPDESESLLWDLAFGRCEADWLTLPHSESGVAVTAWRSPQSAASLGFRAQRLAASGDFDDRYVSKETLAEIAEACREGSRSGFGLFTIFQA